MADVLPPATNLGVFVPQGPLTPGLQASIEKAIAQAVPEGKHGAVVALLDKDGPRFGLAFKTTDGDWRLGVEAGLSWSGKPSGQLSVVHTW